jgi:hypothetical protein
MDNILAPLQDAFEGQIVRSPTTPSLPDPRFALPRLALVYNSIYNADTKLQLYPTTLPTYLGIYLHKCLAN